MGFGRIIPEKCTWPQFILCVLLKGMLVFLNVFRCSERLVLASTHSHRSAASYIQLQLRCTRHSCLKQNGELNQIIIILTILLIFRNINNVQRYGQSDLCEVKKYEENVEETLKSFELRLIWSSFNIQVTAHSQQ